MESRIIIMTMGAIAIGESPIIRSIMFFVFISSD